MEGKNKRIIIVLMTLTIIFTLFGSTLAYWSWNSEVGERTSVTFTTETGNQCSIDGGGNITSGEKVLAPAPCTNSTYAIQRTVQVTPTITNGKPVYIDMWLDVNTLGQGLSDSVNFKYAITKTADSCADPIKSGDFNGKAVEGSTAILLEGVEYTETTTDTYYLYIWLDEAETSSSTMNQVFDLSLNGSCTDTISKYLDDTLNGADPVVVEGLIPVTLSSSASGPVVTTADPNSEWYNYQEKEWANAVLVKSGNRETYQAKYESGEPTVINNDDILAYYVWIPKYSYKMNGVEKVIDISFNETPSGYISHPAFTFNNGQKGIWVGKFESSQGTSSTTGDTTMPTILPSVEPWVEQNISTQFQTSLKFAGGTLTNGVVTFSNSTTYGLTNETDSHMMKNSEWGAVAYLSHSIYGTCTGSTCTEMGINNFVDNYLFQYDFYETGCGDVAGTGESTTCTNEFGFVSTYPQSTNGNITGVFDMAGGASEYVMGVFANSLGDLWTGYDATGHSGFNGYYGTSGTTYAGEYTSGINFPPSKYYDVYKATSGITISAETACNGGVCYGHALTETSGWYGDSAYFVNSGYPWFYRGSYSKDGNFIGLFFFNTDYGVAYTHMSWRSVLI